MGWANFNDRLAILLIFIIPGIWLMEGLGWLKPAPEVNGALIATWTLVIQYYFRKAPPAGGTEG